MSIRTTSTANRFEKFSPGALVSYSAATERFSAELLRYCEDAARRQLADLVSRNHVERAVEYLLVGQTMRGSRLAGPFGALFMGVGVDQLTTMVLSARFSQGGVSLAALFAIGGAALVVHSFSRWNA